MKSIPEIVLARWGSGELVGDAKHQMVVRIRPGVMERGYNTLERIDLTKWPHVTPLIYDGNNSTPWQGQWVPLGDWITLPNIQSSKHGRSFDQNGSSTLTVIQDNIAFTEQSGLAGIYHSIDRGYFSPSRGVVLSSRPDLWTETGWTDVLNGGYQIELWEGYGPDGDPSVIPLDTPDPVTHSCAPPDAAISRTWTGLIETVDLESHPDHITLTCRDFGILFTDQYVQNKNKDPAIIAPTTFADRRTTMGEQAVEGLLPPPNGASGGGLAGNNYEAKGSEGAYLKQHGYYAFTKTDASSRFTSPADAKLNRYAGQYPFETYAFVLTNGWVSAPQPSADSYQWLEMELPAGEYSQFDVYMKFDLEVWVSIYVGPGGGFYDDRTGALGGGWADPDGNGNTPLGTPFVAHFDNIPATWVVGTDDSGNTINASTYAGPYDFGHDFVLPKGSKMRLTFGKLKYRDPTYDTAPPFPEALFETLIGTIQSAESIATSKGLLANAQDYLTFAEAMVDITTTELANARKKDRQLFTIFGVYNSTPLDELPTADKTHKYKTYESPYLSVIMHSDDSNPNPHFLEEYEQQKHYWEGELGRARKSVVAAQKQLKDAYADQAEKATAKAELAALKARYLALWIKDTVHRPGYYADAYTIRAYRLSTTDPSVDVGQFEMGGAAVNAEHWVLVDDASDVIVMLCIWLGFKEWNIDRYGWSLVNPMQWGMDKFFIDIVNDMLGQGNYVFYMGPPTEDDRSIGVPCFKQQLAVANPGTDIVQVDDHLLTEAAEMKWDLSALPGQFIYRGDPVPTDSSDKGQTYENDLVETYMATYFPSWTGADNWTPLDGSDPMEIDPPNRTAGVMRHFIQTVGVNVVIGLTSNEECLFACLLAAVQYALGLCTGQVQVPGMPALCLNDQISVIDKGSGINSRLWIVSVDSEHTGGPNGVWKMVIQGSYIDHADMALTLDDYWTAYKQYLATKQDPITLVPVGQVGF